MSLLIGNYIYQALSTDQDLSALVDDRIYPVAIPEGSTFPFVVYSGINAVGEYTKDGCVADRVNFQVACVARSYTEVTQIADKVRVIIEQIRGENEDSCTNNFELVGSSDGYEVDAYVIVLNFIATTNYKN